VNVSGTAVESAPSGPYFFLSHASHRQSLAGTGDVDGEVVDFFHLVSSHLQNLTTIPADQPPGYLDTLFKVGTVWRDSLRAALSTCRVFVPLYSPRLFASEWCGWEWDAFRRRQAAHARDTGQDEVSAILPVLWTGVRRADLPACAAGLPIGLGAGDDVYRAHGVYGLMMTDPSAYERVALRVAQEIVNVGEASRLPPCRPDVFANPRNVFEEAG
jgi:hypothetical protein